MCSRKQENNVDSNLYWNLKGNCGEYDQYSECGFFNNKEGLKAQIMDEDFLEDYQDKIGTGVSSSQQILLSPVNYFQQNFVLNDDETYTEKEEIIQDIPEKDIQQDSNQDPNRTLTEEDVDEENEENEEKEKLNLEKIDIDSNNVFLNKKTNHKNSTGRWKRKKLSEEEEKGNGPKHSKDSTDIIYNKIMAFFFQLIFISFGNICKANKLKYKLQPITYRNKISTFGVKKLHTFFGKKIKEFILSKRIGEEDFTTTKLINENIMKEIERNKHEQLFSTFLNKKLIDFYQECLIQNLEENPKFQKENEVSQERIISYAKTIPDKFEKLMQRNNKKF